MTDAPAPVVELSGVTKSYGALRPLRIERLSVVPGAQIAIVGLDQPAAEVFINLVTGAALPDTGTVRVFGRPTSEIANGDDWLAALDRYGIVSGRAALLESFTVVQNLALTFSLAIEPVPADVRERAVALAADVGLAASQWEMNVGDLDPLSRIRVRLARAVALEPAVLLLEHPTATIPKSDNETLGALIRRVAESRGTAAISLTMDKEFAAAAGRVLALDAASGRLSEGRFGRIRFWS